MISFESYCIYNLMHISIVSSCYESTWSIRIGVRYCRTNRHFSEKSKKNSRLISLKETSQIEVNGIAVQWQIWRFIKISESEIFHKIITFLRVRIFTLYQLFSTISLIVYSYMIESALYFWRLDDIPNIWIWNIFHFQLA